jgi:hypothetical protein
MARSTVRAHGRVQARYRVGRWPDLSFHAPCCCSVVTRFRGAWSRPFFGDPAVQTISRAWTSTGRVQDRSHWIQDRSAKTRDVTAPDVPCVEDCGRLPKHSDLFQRLARQTLVGRRGFRTNCPAFHARTPSVFSGEVHPGFWCSGIAATVAPGPPVTRISKVARCRFAFDLLHVR